MKNVPEVDLDPVPRSHPRTPDIQTVAGTILWSSKHSFVHTGYAFNTRVISAAIVFSECGSCRLLAKGCSQSYG